MKCHAFVFGLSLFAAKWGCIFCCGESWGRKSLQFHTLPHVPDTRIPRTVARFFHLLSPDTSELNRRIPDNRLLTTATRFFRPLTASEVVLKECLVRKWYSGKHCMEELHRRKSSFAVCEKFTFNNLTQQKPYYFHGIEGSRLDRNSTFGSWRNFASHHNRTSRFNSTSFVLGTWHRSFSFVVFRWVWRNTSVSHSAFPTAFFCFPVAILLQYGT